MEWEMRRSAQKMADEDAMKVLAEQHTGVLALISDGEPYAVPVNYALLDGKIYIHGSSKGRKIEAIRQNEKVSLCVVDTSEPIPEELATRYRSVIVFGKARELSGDELRRRALDFGLRYNPDRAFVAEEVEKELPGLSVIEIAPDIITGKTSKKF